MNIKQFHESIAKGDINVSILTIEAAIEDVQVGNFSDEPESESKASTSAESRVVTFTISTASVDRHGDTIDVDGWDFTAFMKNPVVLWGHDYRSLPIGRALKVWKHGGKIKASVEFASEEMNPLAERVFRMVKSGFLKASSVGMRPIKWKVSEDEDRKRMYGIDFLEQELLEFSIVTVPANAEALAETPKKSDEGKLAVKDQEVPPVIDPLVGVNNRRREIELLRVM